MQSSKRGRTALVVEDEWLLRGRGEWVFPFASVILAGFIVYMSYELLDEWSNWILALVLFDTFTLSLVLNEWRNWHRASRT